MKVRSILSCFLLCSTMLSGCLSSSLSEGLRNSHAPETKIIKSEYSGLEGLELARLTVNIFYEDQGTAAEGFSMDNLSKLADVYVPSDTGLKTRLAFVESDRESFPDPILDKIESIEGGTYSAEYFLEHPDELNYNNGKPTRYTSYFEYNGKEVEISYYTTMETDIEYSYNSQEIDGYDYPVYYDYSSSSEESSYLKVAFYRGYYGFDREEHFVYEPRIYLVATLRDFELGSVMDTVEFVCDELVVLDDGYYDELEKNPNFDYTR